MPIADEQIEQVTAGETRGSGHKHDVRHTQLTDFPICGRLLKKSLLTEDTENMERFSQPDADFYVRRSPYCDW
jgi:hypothetical protein